jgi:hypothetical protein
MRFELGAGTRFRLEVTDFTLLPALMTTVTTLFANQADKSFSSSVLPKSASVQSSS